MNGASDFSRDPDRVAANAHDVPPAVLADIAARRWDLHAEIANNPRAYPELIRWMSAVNPAGGVPTQPWPVSPGLPTTPHSGGHPAPHTASPPVPTRRRGAGWWFAGCGCLAVVAVASLAFLGLGAALTPSESPGTNDTAPEGGSPVPETATDPQVAEQIASFRADQPRINELAAQLEGNPVAPLVADLRTFRSDEKRADDPTLGIYEAKPIAERAAALRAELEQRVSDAQARRTNASGSLTEGIVDAAGNGFIDIRWDSGSVCTGAEPGREIIGCVLSSDPLTIHLLPENEVGSTWANEMLVTHELAHVYQAADDQGAEDFSGTYNDLFTQGLFQGSKEVMADCFALTYYDRWSMSNGSESQGTGYVCNESERQAIREWAAGLNVPMG